MDSTKRAYNFALNIIKFIDKLPKNTSDQIISKQLLRAATSIGANMTEAKASPSRKDFTNFFNHSLKSANETRYWLELLRDSSKADRVVVDSLLKEVTELSNILGASILTLRGCRKF
ncbi:MAG TPA: four helix bundle protein [Candidatus Omnitrophota bacterium]|nr:four helix bundle protein [Candidatus Omnitrophota bacterium]